jgi:glutamine cyclotransferase
MSHENKNLFSIDESGFKPMFHKGDTLKLVVINKENKKIDSVVYFNNDIKIGSRIKNSVINYSLNKDKFGYQNIKAIVYFEGEKSTIDTRIEILSSIEPKLLSYTVVNSYPHDVKSFTEGLEFYNGFLFESTGQKGTSYFRKIDYKTGKVITQINLDSKYFGEGITFINNQLFQLTWQDSVGFIYNANTFKLEKEFKYDKQIEGWGMTNNSTFIFQSDGTEKIWKMNPKTIKMEDYINVYTNSSKIKNINELEWVQGTIYANIWQKDVIIQIEPTTGVVLGVLDLSDLRNKIVASSEDFLNGIAYNSATKTFFVTGKNWNKLFEIKIK